jgi:nanoRNase/pAp phosphatase (c-di-AMP/oligoRNAs hydrolase)
MSRPQAGTDAPEDDASRVASLLEATSRASRVIILTHDNPDPDAVASAAGLRALIKAKLDIPVVATFGGIIGRAENRSLMDVIGTDFERIEGFEFRPGDAFALVDAQPGAGNNVVPETADLAVVIDHHPPRMGPARADYHDVRESYGATSTILVELLRAAGVEPDQRLATGMFYAIQSETQDLGREASTSDIEASIYLYPRTDPGALSVIRHAQVPTGLFEALHDGLERAWRRAGVVCVPVGRLAYPDLVAQLADFFLRVQGVDWVVAMGRHQDDVLISVRAEQPEAHAGERVREVVGQRGTAGGHGQMAGGRVPAAGLTDERIDALIDELFERFCELEDVADEPRCPLLARKPAAQDSEP